MRRSRTASVIITAMAAVALGLAAAAPPSMAEADGRDARAIWINQDIGAFDVAYSAYGRAVYVVGNMPGAEDDADIFVRRYSVEGQLMWQRLIATDKAEFARGVAVDTKGNVVVAGWRNGPNSDDVLLARYSPTGKKLWEKSYDDVFNGADRASAVAIDNDGHIWVAGRVPGATDGSAEIWWSEWNAKGRMLHEWTAEASIIGWAEAFDIEVRGNTVYLAGSVFETTPDGYVGVYSDAWLAAFSTEGYGRWQRTWGTPGYDDVARGVEVSSDNQVYVTGEVYSTTTAEDIFLRRYTAKGKRIWNRVLRHPGTDCAGGVTASRTGAQITLTGTRNCDDFDSDAFLYSTSRRNIERWRWTSPDDPTYPDRTRTDAGLAITSGGNLFVAGRQTPNQAALLTTWPWLMDMSTSGANQPWSTIFNPLP